MFPAGLERPENRALLARRRLRMTADSMISACAFDPDAALVEMADALMDTCLGTAPGHNDKDAA